MRPWLLLLGNFCLLCTTWSCDTPARYSDMHCSKRFWTILSSAQGVVTPIGAVVTAATGVKKFWPAFLLLDHLTTPQMGPWPFDRTHLTTLCAIRTRKTLISWPLLPSLKIVLDRLTDNKNSLWPLDHFLIPVAAVTTAPMGMTTPWVHVWILSWYNFCLYFPQEDQLGVSLLTLDQVMSKERKRLSSWLKICVEWLFS